MADFSADEVGDATVDDSSIGSTPADDFSGAPPPSDVWRGYVASVLTYNVGGPPTGSTDPIKVSKV